MRRLDLDLGHVYAITSASELGEKKTLEGLARCHQRGVRLVQFREKELLDAQEFFCTFLERCRNLGMLCLVNAHHTDLVEEACGVHWRSHELFSSPMSSKANKLIGASCHNETELRRAQGLGADFATLSPVLPTKSHPEAKPLGWARFACLVSRVSLPVFALGGLSWEDLPKARGFGAQGIALMRDAWG